MSAGARYRKIYDAEWHAPAFRALENGAQVVRLYVSAGPQTTSCGCFRLSTAVAVEDLGGTSEEFERHLTAVREAYGWPWDASSRVIWISNWFDINPPASPNVVASWAKLMKNVPDCDVKRQAIASIGHSLKSLSAPFREPWADLPKTFPRSESEPQNRPQTNQGAGIRELRSGSEGAGAARDSHAADNTSGHAPTIAEIAATVEARRRQQPA